MILEKALKKQFPSPCIPLTPVWMLKLAALVHTSRAAIHNKYGLHDNQIFPLYPYMVVSPLLHVSRIPNIGSP